MNSIETFPDSTELEARYGFSIDALEQFESIFRYLDEEAPEGLLDEIVTNREGFDQLVNFATELRVCDGVNYDA